MGTIWAITYCVYALAFWYGIKLTIDHPDEYSAGRTMIVSGHPPCLTRSVQ